jgi:hypothetical protein
MAGSPPARSRSVKRVLQVAWAPSSLSPPSLPYHRGIETARTHRLAAALSARIGALAAELRARDVRIGVGEVVAAHRALAAVDASSREDAYLALRAVLCSTPSDLLAFTEAFAAVFGAVPGAPGEPLEDAPPAPDRWRPPHAGPPQDRPDPADEPGDPAPAAWSDLEVLRLKDFSLYTEADRVAARRLVRRLAARAPRRRSRRTRRAHGRGRIPDLRATVRASLRHGGELVERRWREPAERRRRLVLVCDVSGSMAAYSHMLLLYVQACVATHASVEAFAFGTRLTRLTRELAGDDPDAAIARATSQLPDRAGGTRIGAALAELNRAHGRRIGRGAVVVVLSDGWDRGDPEELAAEMARLRRCSHRLVWLNPLAADPRYEPLTRGMQAALPHVDRLLPGNSIASLEEVAMLVEAGLA